MCKKLRVIFCTAIAAAALSGCGITGIFDKPEETTTLFTTTVSTTARKTSRTTRNDFYAGQVDADDEDYTGYTTTTLPEGEALENEFSREEDDPAMAATRQSHTEAKTFYTIPEHNGTTAPAVTVSAAKTTTTAPSTIALGDGTTASKKTTTTTTATTTTTTTTKATTAFNANALFEADDTMRYSEKVRYKVTSDTTYLNLRYGPSKSYSIILQIPDGSFVYGQALATESNGAQWVNVEYDGHEGWVMRELLTISA